MRQDIKERIELVRQGEVPDGYKHERGYTIPLDWNFQEFSKKTFRLTRKNAISCERVLTISAQQGLIDQREFYNHSYASEDKSGYYLLKKGEFAYNRSYSDGYPFGAIKRLDRYKEGVVSPLYICFALRDKTNSEFFAQYFESGRYNREIYKVAQEGARNHGLLNVGTTDFFDGIIVEPPMDEQNRIAEILMCCGKAIALKKQLVEEKRKQKKWLMQNLFDPDSGVRLPGFKGSKWYAVVLGSVCKMFSGGTPTASNIDYYKNGTIPFIRSGEIQESKTELYLSELALENSSAKMVNIGDLLYALYGANSGNSAISKIRGAINQAILCIRSELLNISFLYYLLENEKENIISTYIQGGQGNLSGDIIKKLRVFTPSLVTEQTAIANILSTADREIELLEQELAEWQAKKKALMQLLLTGLVRV